MNADGSWLHPLLALLLAPLLPGVVNRVKAWVAGRQGPPLLQLYYDLAKCLAKGAVYSRTTTFVFRAGPCIGLVCTVLALALLPAGRVPAPVRFPGDLLVLVGLLALGRFATVTAALDTGSSFEGMGGSREVQYGALAEPALFLGLLALAQVTGSVSLSGIFGSVEGETWRQAGTALALVLLSLSAVFLAENARVPFDDPATHLELTMIHEVMVLDHGGPDLALIDYAAALKLWVLGSLVGALLVPVRPAGPAGNLAVTVAGLLAVAVVLGGVESTMARMRLLRVPQFLLGATVAGLLALLLQGLR